MPELRSRTVTHGRNMAGARALMRASGVANSDIGKPIVAVANSFTEFVPGHTHLQPVGRIVSEAILAAGAVPREFNTIAVDDGIAMGHGGMLYSLPSRDLIADSVEYMVEAHCADALICISNCDKITPGMLMAALRLNIPTVFVSGGPMEAGTATLVDGTVRKLDLINAISDAVERERLRRGHPPHRGERLPDLRLVLRHVHRQLDELPDRGDRPGAARQRLGAGHPHRAPRAVRAGRRHRRRAHQAVLRAGRRARCCRAPSPPGPRSRTPWRWTSRWAARPTRSCTCWRPPRRPSSTYGLTRHRRGLAPRAVPVQGRAERRAGGTYYMEDVHRAGGIPAILGELYRGGLLNEDVHTVHSPSRQASGWTTWDVRGGSASPEAVDLFHAAPGCVRSADAFSQSERWDTPGHRRGRRLHPRRRPRVLHRRRPRRPARQPRGGRLRREDGRRRRVDLDLRGPGRRLRVAGGGRRQDPRQAESRPATSSSSATRARAAAPACRRCSTRRPSSRAAASGKSCALVTDGRFSGGTSGLSIGHASPGGGLRRHIALVEDGDRIRIDIPNRSIELLVAEDGPGRPPRGPERRLRPRGPASARSPPRCAPTRRWPPAPTGAPSATSPSWSADPEHRLPPARCRPRAPTRSRGRRRVRAFSEVRGCDNDICRFSGRQWTAITFAKRNVWIPSCDRLKIQVADESVRDLHRTFSFSAVPPESSVGPFPGRTMLFAAAVFAGVSGPVLTWTLHRRGRPGPRATTGQPWHRSWPPRAAHGRASGRYRRPSCDRACASLRGVYGRKI